MGEQSGGPGVFRPGFLFETHGPPASPDIPKHVAERKLLRTPTCHFLCYYGGRYIEKNLERGLWRRDHLGPDQRPKWDPEPRTSLGTAWLCSRRRVLPPVNPRTQHVCAGKLGYPADWRTIADQSLELALAGLFPCPRWIHSGAVRVGFGRSGLLV